MRARKHKIHHTHAKTKTPTCLTYPKSHQMAMKHVSLPFAVILRNQIIIHYGIPEIYLVFEKPNVNNSYMPKYHIFRHFHTVNRHRFLVFTNCVRCGIPWRGLVHDLSKYSPKEFFPSARYCTGKKSPIGEERKAEGGYSSVFIHHTRKNRHHFEYWVDVTTGDIILSPMPYKFALEMCCDMISASKVYNGKNYDRSMPLAYFEKNRNRSMMHSATKDFIQQVLTRYKDSGFRKIKKKDTKKIYMDITMKYPKIEKILVFSKED